MLEGYKLPSGTIVINDKEQKIKDKGVCIYARVSSAENKNNLESQVKRLIDYCMASGYIIKKIIKEVGSGVNDNRQKLNKLLENNNYSKLIIEHKDRLTRFGFNYIDILFKQLGKEIVVVNEIEDDKQDLIQDFISIITSFCARIYGQRRGKRKTEKIIEDLKSEKNE
jgi:predicted site-specific integrase-resolvase